MKDAAVRQVREHGWTCVDVARDLQSHPNTVNRWVHNAIAQEAAEAKRTPTPEQVERQTLERRLQQLEEENAGWRRAAAGALTRLQRKTGSGSAEQASARPSRGPLSSEGFAGNPLAAIPVQSFDPEPWL